MTTLHLGVMDVAYSDPEAPGAVTTGEVAEHLEKKYHVMEVFYELHAKEIANAIGSAVSERMESILQGNVQGTLNGMDIGDIENKFKQYLSMDEWKNTTGQTIAAAKEGVSHRFKSVTGKTLTAKQVASGKAIAAGKVLKKPRGPRPAFIDTGLYQQSFKAWLK